MKIPALDFDMGGYTVGGRFTTLEGLLNNIVEEVKKKHTGVASGPDGSAVPDRRRARDFTTEMKELMTGQKEFLFILDDPSGNSYLQVVFSEKEVVSHPSCSLVHHHAQGNSSLALSVGYMGETCFD